MCPRTILLQWTWIHSRFVLWRQRMISLSSVAIIVTNLVTISRTAGFRIDGKSDLMATVKTRSDEPPNQCFLWENHFPSDLEFIALQGKLIPTNCPCSSNGLQRNLQLQLRCHYRKSIHFFKLVSLSRNPWFQSLHRMRVSLSHLTIIRT